MDQATIRSIVLFICIRYNADEVAIALTDSTYNPSMIKLLAIDKISCTIQSYDGFRRSQLRMYLIKHFGVDYSLAHDITPETTLQEFCDMLFVKFASDV